MGSVPRSTPIPSSGPLPGGEHLDNRHGRGHAPLVRQRHVDPHGPQTFGHAQHGPVQLDGWPSAGIDGDLDVAPLDGTKRWALPAACATECLEHGFLGRPTRGETAGRVCALAALRLDPLVRREVPLRPPWPRLDLLAHPCHIGQVDAHTDNHGSPPGAVLRRAGCWGTHRVRNGRTRRASETYIMTTKSTLLADERLGPMDAAAAGAEVQATGAALRHGLDVRCGTARWAPAGRVVLTKRIEAHEAGRERLVIELESAAPGSASAGSAPCPLVAVLIGSPSDEPAARAALEVLERGGVTATLRVLSAHRTPDEVVRFVREATQQGVEVFVAGAGLAAHLAGVVAANTHRPVIGVPLSAGTLGGLDALLSTVQMPPGVPVATVGVDNMKNAAWLALRILALKHPAAREALAAGSARARARYGLE